MSFENPIVVEALALEPAAPVHGDLVTVRMTVSTKGYTSFLVPCSMVVDGTTIAQEQRASQPVFSSFQVTSGWIATVGAHHILGRAGQQGETRLLRDNRREIDVTVAGPPTAQWLADWKEGARRGVRSWLAGSRVRGGVVDGHVARLTAGSLGSDAPLHAVMLATLLVQGVPAAVAAAVSSALDEAWARWFAGYHAVLMYDPSFDAFPGPVHPPAPNIIPVPLLAPPGGSDAAQALAAPGLEVRIREELRALAGGLTEAVRQFAIWFAGRFDAWAGTAVLAEVMASGPVPTFAPPYIPFGPVIHGTLESRRGVLGDRGVFDAD